MNPPVDTVITTLELLIFDVITAVPILVLLLITSPVTKLPKAAFDCI